MWKRILKIALITVTILLVVGAGFTWRAHAQMEQAIAQLREDGHPVTLQDLKRDVPAEENAATYLFPVAAEAEELYSRIYPFAHANVDDFDWKNGLTDEQVAKTAEGFDAFPRVLEALDQAAECRESAWPMDFSKPANEIWLEASQPMRQFARLNDCRARYLLSLGKPDKAAAVYLQQLRLCRMQDKEPTLVLFLVNTACRSIAVGSLGQLMQVQELSEATHQAIETELALHDAMPGYAHALRTEIPVGIESFQRLPVIGTKFANDYLRYMNEQIKIGAEEQFLYAQRKAPQVTGPAATLVPAIEASREGVNRIRSLIRCLRILNKIHAGGYETGTPISLAILGLPKPCTIDPFSGKPLIIKTTESGWTVYSIGRNLLDDGGDLKEMADVGFGTH